MQLRKQYSDIAKQEVIEILLSNKERAGVKYELLFSKVMSFPLLTVDDLLGWISALHPHVRIELAGSKKRRKPSPFENDRILVLNYDAVSRFRQN